MICKGSFFKSAVAVWLWVHLRMVANSIRLLLFSIWPVITNRRQPQHELKLPVRCRDTPMISRRAWQTSLPRRSVLAFGSDAAVRAVAPDRCETWTKWAKSIEEPPGCRCIYRRRRLYVDILDVPSPTICEALSHLSPVKKGVQQQPPLSAGIGHFSTHWLPCHKLHVC
jgi:hypothetical protein